MAGLGKLYLIPNFIGDEEIETSFPQENQNIIQSISQNFLINSCINWYLNFVYIWTKY